MAAPGPSAPALTGRPPPGLTRRGLPGTILRGPPPDSRVLRRGGSPGRRGARARPAAGHHAVPAGCLARGAAAVLDPRHHPDARRLPVAGHAGGPRAIQRIALRGLRHPQHPRATHQRDLGAPPRPRGQPVDRHGDRRPGPLPRRRVHGVHDARRAGQRHRVHAGGGPRGCPVDRDQRRAVALPGRTLQHVRAARAQERQEPPPRRRGPALDRHGRRRSLLPAGRRPHPLHEEGRARERSHPRGLRGPQGPRLDRDRRERHRPPGRGALHASRLTWAHPRHHPQPRGGPRRQRMGGDVRGRPGAVQRRARRPLRLGRGPAQRHRVLAVRGPRGQPVDRHGRRRARAAARHQAAAAHAARGHAGRPDPRDPAGPDGHHLGGERSGRRHARARPPCGREPAGRPPAPVGVRAGRGPERRALDRHAGRALDARAAGPADLHLARRAPERSGARVARGPAGTDVGGHGEGARAARGRALGGGAAERGDPGSSCLLDRRGPVGPAVGRDDGRRRDGHRRPRLRDLHHAAGPAQRHRALHVRRPRDRAVDRHRRRPGPLRGRALPRGLRAPRAAWTTSSTRCWTTATDGCGWPPTAASPTRSRPTCSTRRSAARRPFAS